MGKRVLAINLGWEQERLVRLLVEEGCKVIGVHPDDRHAQDLGVARVERLDTRDIERLLRLARDAKVDAVVCDQDDYAYFSSAVICEALNLPGPRVREAQIATNKYWQRQAAQAAGIRQPSFQLCNCVEDARVAAERLGYPVIVKPVDNRGSFGVSPVESEHALTEACHYAITYAHSRMFLVERYIPGTNIIIDGYVFPQTGHRSLALGSKTMSRAAPYLAQDIAYPGLLPRQAYDKAIRTHDNVVKALGFRFGMTSGEYIVDDEGEVWLVEVANRGGGVLIAPVIVPAISGIDVTRQLIFDALGIERDLSTDSPTGQPAHAAYLKYFMLPAGRVASVRGLDRAGAVPGVAALKFLGKAGQEITEARHAGDRQGLFITFGGSLEEAQARAAAVMEAIEFAYA